jgi:hypothetical protein
MNTRIRAEDVGDDLKASGISKFTLAAAKDALTYVLENVIENENVTRALKHEGIDNIISFVKLTDDSVDNLAYHDCPSIIEGSMMLVMLLTCGHSSKLDVLET